MGRTKAPKTLRLLKEVEFVLSTASEPLHYEDIARKIEKRKVFTEFGRTPSREIYTGICNDMNSHPDQTIFTRSSDRGFFALKNHSLPKKQRAESNQGRRSRPESRSIPERQQMWTTLMSRRSRHGGSVETPIWDKADGLYLGIDSAGHRMIYLKCELERGREGQIKKGEYFHAAKETQPDAEDGMQWIVLRQVGEDRHDRFTPLVRMVLEEVLGEPEIDPTVFRDAIETAVDRMGGSGDGILSSYQQMGLTAELWFLQNILMTHLAPEDAVAAWHGQKGSEIDFWLPGVRIEVKAAGRTKSWVTISSPEQLETDELGAPLYLFNLSLAGSMAKGARDGKTLTEYVDGVREEIQKRHNIRDPRKCRELFDQRLFGTIPTDLGNKRYREDHREKYKTKYRVYWNKERPDNQRGAFYVVEGKFPRLRSDYLKKNGLRLTTYDIDLDRCDAFRRGERELIPLLRIKGK